jgi:catechol 2,3-dioxygenase-like lactoylglutathione lyase family enzyme
VTTRPILAALIPELDVSDLARSRDFYLRVAGFDVLYERPEDGFVMLALGDARLMIQQDNGNWRTGPLEHPYGRGINFEIDVPDADALHARIVVAGWPIFVPPQTRWYRADQHWLGNRQFLVQDPDGYLLRFAQSLGVRTTAA